ncbi:MAG: selenocysteine-specific translation elongation factor [Verrucomicrobiota bacterium]
MSSVVSKSDVTTRHFIVGTAGHVDHGKSALVKALTGTDPDRLPEEKARGITIDLGFAELNLTAPNGDNIHAGIVDVPGHEDFVRNMIAGVGSIDLALFVVAADDGWMPQTEEHLQILNYLGAQHAVIALTKCDLGNVETVSEQLREQLRESPFADARIVPTSIRTGEGIEDLKNAMVATLASMQPQRDLGKPRLFIDRVFMLHGIGTVVTGTLNGGQLRRGQAVVIQPQNVDARIRSIQSHGYELESVQPGTRTAINLPDIAIEEIQRGNVITVVDLGQASSSMIVQLQRSSRLRSARPLKSGSSVYLHHGASRVSARIVFSDAGQIARLKLASPVFAFLGDRFVIRDASERHTIAGGVVLDPDGGKNYDSPVMPGDVDACVQVDIARREFARKETILTKSHFSLQEIAEALRRLEDRHGVVVRGEIVATTEAWQELRTRATALIDNAHKQNPERPGLDLNGLRTVLGKQRVGNLFDVLINDLCTADFVRRGSAIARVQHRPALPIALQAAETRVREALSKKPFDPPARKEFEQDRQVVRFLIESGQLIELGTDLVLLEENFEKMKSAVVDFISQNGASTVSELRQALESSRRIMVPLLERLDRNGVTRRVGDKRIVAS